MGATRYHNAASQARIAQIAAFLVGRDPVTIAQIMAEVGLAETTVNGYVKHMVDTGQIRCVQRATYARGGSVAATWAAGDGNVVDKQVDTRCVVVRKVWAEPVPRMFEPMACLFGRAA